MVIGSKLPNVGYSFLMKLATCPVLKKVYTYNNKNVSKIKIKYYV